MELRPVLTKRQPQPVDRCLICQQPGSGRRLGQEKTAGRGSHRRQAVRRYIPPIEGAIRQAVIIPIAPLHDLARHADRQCPLIENLSCRTIEQGDLLVTSGLGGIFPAGYPVAVVETVTRLPQEPFASVTARPLASLNQVREVMLIWTENEATPVDIEAVSYTHLTLPTILLV